MGIDTEYIQQYWRSTTQLRIDLWVRPAASWLAKSKVSRPLQPLSTPLSTLARWFDADVDQEGWQRYAR